jgi:hypothetical protein
MRNGEWLELQGPQFQYLSIFDKLQLLTGHAPIQNPACQCRTSAHPNRYCSSLGQLLGMTDVVCVFVRHKYGIKVFQLQLGLRQPLGQFFDTQAAVN